eukprot:CCRYP_020676-RA/>CCRYP_020676-RA protein AED:0.40 eAED:0.62 QI:284/0/0.5/1/0/0/2/0/94
MKPCIRVDRHCNKLHQGINILIFLDIHRNCCTAGMRGSTAGVWRTRCGGVPRPIRRALGSVRIGPYNWRSRGKARRSGGTLVSSIGRWGDSSVA